MSDPIAQLKALQNDRQAGWAAVEAREKGKAQLMEAIGHQEVEPVEVVAPGVAAYTRWVLTDFISKPLAAGAAVFVLLAGGWMTTVSAASNSLPGETLYNIKLVTEQTKLTFASNENKTLLHTEFAQRRLDEATALTQNGDAELAQSVMVEFAKQVEMASDGLRELQSEGSKDTVKVATILDQEIEKLNSSIQVMSTNEVDETETEAIEATKAASNDVVNIMVESHEAQSSDQVTEGLEVTFRGEYNEINARKTYLLGRIEVLRSALSANPELATAVGFTDVTLVKRANIVTNTAARVSEALDLTAGGGFRAAFEILRDIDDILATSEDRVAQLEIEVTSTLAELNSAPAVEDTSTTESTSDSKIVDHEGP